MTEAEIYVVGMLAVLLLCAYGMMRWNRYLIRSHRVSSTKDQQTRA
jgi:hypothetical protein